mmetsp:Transcript_57369/g.181623  ORF Transcript_57369/g.181623 Transcript_57369/m.181623 type:complete len:86 (+) Transcript_57369:443-700(+)
MGLPAGPLCRWRVQEGAPELVEACDAAGLSYVQLHGDDARAGLSKIPMKLGAIWVVSADAGGKIQVEQPPASETAPHHPGSLLAL